MAKETLLQLTQNILSDMESDEVNSINDTVESLQVASVIRDTFFNIISGRDYPHTKALLSLEPSGDVNRPSYMHLPDNVINVSSVRYNKRKLTDIRDKYEEVDYKLPEDFIKFVDGRDSSSASIVTVVDFSGVSLYIKNNTPPTFYTSFDDEWLIFDSYDAGIDDTLKQSKVQCFGTEMPIFLLEDSFVADIPIQLFPYLKNEAKSTCFLILKQMPNQKAEQHSITQRRRMSQEAWRLQNGITRPDYGRKSKKK